MAVGVGARLGAIDGVEDGMFGVLDGLNVMLVIVRVVQGMVSAVVTVIGNTMVVIILVAAGLGAIDGAEDGVLMEFDRLDIVLVIKGVIESVMGVVVSVVLNLGVSVSITVFVWGRFAAVVIVVLDVVFSDRAEDGMFGVLDGLDIVLVIEGVIESAVCVMIGVVGDLVDGHMLVRGVAMTVSVLIGSCIMLRVAMVSIEIVLSAFVAAGLGAIDGAEDGVFVELYGLNIVLVVVGVIEGVVGVMIGMVLNLGVAVAVAILIRSHISVSSIDAVSVGAGFGTIDGAEDCMFVELNWLNIVLVIKGMIEGVMGIVISMVLCLVLVVMVIWLFGTVLRGVVVVGLIRSGFVGPAVSLRLVVLGGNNGLVVGSGSGVVDRSGVDWGSVVDGSGVVNGRGVGNRHVGCNMMSRGGGVVNRGSSVMDRGCLVDDRRSMSGFMLLQTDQFLSLMVTTKVSLVRLVVVISLDNLMVDLLVLGNSRLMVDKRLIEMTFNNMSVDMVRDLVADDVLSEMVRGFVMNDRMVSSLAVNDGVVLLDIMIVVSLLSNDVINISVTVVIVVNDNIVSLLDLDDLALMLQDLSSLLAKGSLFLSLHAP